MVSVQNHGIEEVRARVKVDTQKAAAREAAARLVRGLDDTPHSVVLTQPAIIAEPEPNPLIQPSFEMYSPETDEAEKFDVDEDDDGDDSNGSIDDDIAPDTNFNLPPHLVVSPLKANPLGGGVAAFGTPPFLEQCQARGDSDLVNLSMRRSIDLQQVRPD